MKLVPDDFQKLQYSLLAMVLMFAIGVISVVVAYQATKTASIDRVATQTDRNDARSKLQRVRGEESEIKQKSALFNQLQARGMVGEEQRLEWVELIREIRDKRRLIDLQYEFAPQRSLDNGAPGNGYAFYASTMKVQLKLLHEEDLTRFVDDLRRQAKALIQVKSCNVSRLPRNETEGSVVAQLQADCLIDWLTLQAVAKK